MSKSKLKRNRALIILMFPILAVLFYLGWTLSWIGSAEKKKKQK